MSLHTLSYEIKTVPKDHSERRYLDFLISGQPLKDFLGIDVSGTIGLLGWGFAPEFEYQLIREYLNEVPPELESGQIRLYGCSECADIACGALTAKLVMNKDIVIWKDFAYENDYEPIDYFVTKPTIQFERQEYEELFRHILSKFLPECSSDYSSD